MFGVKQPLFIYCISPVHMGAGTALGAVDNPIQREVHTGHPNMAGSGLKGAFRDVFEAKKGPEETDAIFGPVDRKQDEDDQNKKTRASDHAGAISFADAQLVLFPVRSLRRSFVYATCPTALGRLQRLLAIAGIEDAKSWNIPELKTADECVVVEGSEAVDKERKLVLEAYRFEARPDAALGAIVLWLADNALPADEGTAYFRSKLQSDLVLLSDERFNHFVRHATLVEPHVRISDESGTADDGGLFYTENLPPESLLVSLAMASKQRVKKGNSDGDGKSAAEVLKAVRGSLDGELVQVGGDATTGRGQVVLRFAGGA